MTAFVVAWGVLKARRRPPQDALFLKHYTTMAYTRASVVACGVLKARRHPLQEVA
jgi:hypothetical protein